MKSDKQYAIYRKPSWAPTSWVFGPVWSVLYIIIAISFGSVAYLYSSQVVPFAVALPFLLNLISNVLYTPIQFGLRNFYLATLDIFIVLGTLVWALVAIYPYASWIAFVNLPYLVWVSFATVLQITITWLNKK